VSFSDVPKISANFKSFRNECFGLLGVNGAGKTSTFKMLTVIFSNFKKRFEKISYPFSGR
jgi:ABC-type multidrug transport system ATPase subunit